MAEYIERSEAVEFVKNNTPSFGDTTTMQCVERSLANVPAADVVEVVHGEWVENITYHNANSLFREYGFDVAETLLYHTCSCCNALGSNSFNYCPHCGAKMDGERRSE